MIVTKIPQEAGMSTICRSQQIEEKCEQQDGGIMVWFNIGYWCKYEASSNGSLRSRKHRAMLLIMFLKKLHFELMYLIVMSMGTYRDDNDIESDDSDNVIESEHNELGENDFIIPTFAQRVRQIPAYKQEYECNGSEDEGMFMNKLVSVE